MVTACGQGGKRGAAGFFLALPELGPRHHHRPVILKSGHPFAA
jgi:hypothetical protein